MQLTRLRTLVAARPAAMRTFSASATARLTKAQRAKLEEEATATESQEDVRADNNPNIKPDAKLQKETERMLAAKAKLEAEQAKKGKK